MSFRIATASIATAAILLVTSITPASPGGGTADQRNACMADAFKFCWDAIPNETKIEACLKRHSHKISKACRHEVFDDTPTGTVVPAKQTGPTPVAPVARE